MCQDEITVYWTHVCMLCMPQEIALPAVSTFTVMTYDQFDK